MLYSKSFDFRWGLLPTFFTTCLLINMSISITVVYTLLGLGTPVFIFWSLALSSNFFFIQFNQRVFGKYWVLGKLFRYSVAYRSFQVEGFIDYLLKCVLWMSLMVLACNSELIVYKFQGLLLSALKISVKFFKYCTSFLCGMDCLSMLFFKMKMSF